MDPAFPFFGRVRTPKDKEPRRSVRELLEGLALVDVGELEEWPGAKRKKRRHGRHGRSEAFTAAT